MYRREVACTLLVGLWRQTREWHARESQSRFTFGDFLNSTLQMIKLKGKKTCLIYCTKLVPYRYISIQEMQCKLHFLFINHLRAIKKVCLHAIVLATAKYFSLSRRAIINTYANLRNKRPRKAFFLSF